MNLLAALSIWKRLRREIHLKFVTIGYGDQAGYDRTDQPYGMPRTHTTPSCNAGVSRWGSPAKQPVQVRNHDAVATTSEHGPVPVLGATDGRIRDHRGCDLGGGRRVRREAPCAVAHGVVEVWPLQESGT